MERYNIVIKPNLKDLIRTVNEAVESGYTPIGGIIQTDTLQFIQAIFIYKPILEDAKHN